MKRRTVVWVAVAAAALVAVMAYGSSRMAKKAGEETLTAEATVMLQAYSADDYVAFSASFSDDMLSEMGPDAFEAWRAPLFAATGPLLEIVDVTTKTLDGGSRRVVMHADFAAGADIRFAVTFLQDTALVTHVALDAGG